MDGGSGDGVVVRRANRPENPPKRSSQVSETYAEIGATGKRTGKNYFLWKLHLKDAQMKSNLLVFWWAGKIPFILYFSNCSIQTPKDQFLVTLFFFYFKA